MVAKQALLLLRPRASRGLLSMMSLTLPAHQNLIVGIRQETALSGNKCNVAVMLVIL